MFWRKRSDEKITPVEFKIVPRQPWLNVQLFVIKISVFISIFGKNSLFRFFVKKSIFSKNFDF